MQLKIYQYTKYSGNTSNQLVSSKQECSKCTKKTETNFVQSSPSEPKTGYRFCGECLQWWLNQK